MRCPKHRPLTVYTATPLLRASKTAAVPHPCAVGFLTVPKPAVLEERNGEIEFRLVKNGGTRESTIILTEAWPFLNPVNKDEVPDYYNAIAPLMDLSAGRKDWSMGFMLNPKTSSADLKLIFDNCRQCNDPITVYAKCAAKLEKYMWSLMEEIPEWSDLLEE
ncbi:hypothetical protein VTK56DRAFT_738 [Thermocarpiscus australiensis]